MRLFMGYAKMIACFTIVHFEQHPGVWHSCFLRCGVTYDLNFFLNSDFNDLYYKLMTIINDNSRVINKLEASLTDDARVVIYNRHMFIVQATAVVC
jgi:hypothetical protein